MGPSPHPRAPRCRLPSGVRERPPRDEAPPDDRPTAGLGRLPGLRRELGAARSRGEPAASCPWMPRASGLSNVPGQEDAPRASSTSAAIRPNAAHSGARATSANSARAFSASPLQSQ